MAATTHTDVQITVPSRPSATKVLTGPTSKATAEWVRVTWDTPTASATLLVTSIDAAEALMQAGAAAKALLSRDPWRDAKAEVDAALDGEVTA